MSDYVRTESPFGVMNRTAAGLSDPIFETFMRLPHLRAELALQSQRLAMQQQQEDRLNRQLAAELPNIKAQTELHLQQALTSKAQAGNYGAQMVGRLGNSDAADRAMRLATVAGLPEGDFATEALNSTTLGPDLSASGMGSVDLDSTNLSDLGAIIQSAIHANQARVATGSPTAAASYLRPPTAAMQGVKLNPQEGFYDFSGNKVAENTNVKQPTYSDPSAQAAHLGKILEGLDSTGLDFTKQVSGGVTNKVPTALYSATTNALAKALLAAAQPRGSAPSPTAQGKRLRVRGPNGETGTVPEGTQLPDGWNIIQ